MDEEAKKRLMQFQESEITEHHIYRRLSEMCRNARNQSVLKMISDQEMGHYRYLQSMTQAEVKPRWWRVGLYVLISRFFGLTFGLKLMERGEGRAQEAYSQMESVFPKIKEIEEDEERHEKEILGMIEEEKLQYIGSAVLGLNDALVELTGALAGLTLALQNKQIVAAAGLITGIAASLSMAASEYLSTKSEAGGKNPLKAAFYTGIAYILTVLFLVFPFLISGPIYFSLGFSIVNAILVILFFTFYISVAKDLDFRKRFLEMFCVSLGVAALSFFIGFFIRNLFQIDV